MQYAPKHVGSGRETIMQFVVALVLYYIIIATKSFTQHLTWLQICIKYVQYIQIFCEIWWLPQKKL